MAIKTVGLILAVLSTGCAVHEETLYIAGDLVTVKFDGKRPKVRVSTGVDECKWRGRFVASDPEGGNHYLGVNCKIPTDYLIPRMD